MQPVYCIGCRTHIPLAISNANKGYCPTCVPPPKVVPVVDPPKHAYCPQCQSIELEDIVHREPTSARTIWYTGVATSVFALFTCLWIMWVVTIPIALVGISLPWSKVTGTSRRCTACGNQWRI